MVLTGLSVALRLKFQSDPRSNITVRKSDEYIENRLGSLIKLHHFVVVEKRETEYEKWAYYSSLIKK